MLTDCIKCHKNFWSDSPMDMVCSSCQRTSFSSNRQYWRENADEYSYNPSYPSVGEVVENVSMGKSVSNLNVYKEPEQPIKDPKDERIEILEKEFSRVMKELDKLRQENKALEKKCKELEAKQAEETRELVEVSPIISPVK